MKNPEGYHHHQLKAKMHHGLVQLRAYFGFQLFLDLCFLDSVGYRLQARVQKQYI